MKKVKLIIMIICIFLTINTYSKDISEDEKIKIVYTATLEGDVFIDVNSNIKYPIASLTKVMNVLLALEDIQKGNHSLDDKVIFDKETYYFKDGSINAEIGTAYTLEELLKAQMVYSANNAAYATAKYLGNGSIKKYISLMNERAKQLDMNSTEFTSPAGLTPRLNKGYGMDISTARDMYKLTKYALKNTNILDYANIRKISFPNSGYDRVYPNRNELLGKYGIVGLKTGFHLESGFNIILVSKIGDSTVISISMNSESLNERNKLHESILSELENKLFKVVDKDKSYYILDIKNHKNRRLEGYLKEDINLIDVGKEYETRVIYYDLNEDVKKDDIIGEVSVYEGKDLVVTKYIYSKTDNRALKWYEVLLRIFSFGYLI